MRFVRDNLATIVCGIIVCAFMVASTVITLRAHAAATSPIAVVHDSEGRTFELPLATDTELSVTTEKGTNVIRIKNGTCSMAEADCPTGACLRQRAISRPGEQLICLPHELWVEVRQGDTPDTSMDTTAVGYDTDDVDLVAR